METAKGIVACRLGRKEGAKSKETAERDDYHCTCRNERSSSRGEGEMGLAFGEDLFFEAIGDRDVIEGGTGGILKGAMLLEPGVEFGIGFGECDGLGEIGIVAVDGGAIEQQNLSGFLAIHAAPCGDC